MAAQCNYVYTAEGLRVTHDRLLVKVRDADGRERLLRLRTDRGKPRDGEVTVKQLKEWSSRPGRGADTRGRFDVLVEGGFAPVGGLHLDPARAQGRRGRRQRLDEQALWTLPEADREQIALSLVSSISYGESDPAANATRAAWILSNLPTGSVTGRLVASKKLHGAAFVPEAFSSWDMEVLPIIGGLAAMSRHLPDQFDEFMSTRPMLAYALLYGKGATFDDARCLGWLAEEQVGPFIGQVRRFSEPVERLKVAHPGFADASMVVLERHGVPVEKWHQAAFLGSASRHVDGYAMSGAPVETWQQLSARGITGQHAAVWHLLNGTSFDPAGPRADDHLDAMGRIAYALPEGQADLAEAVDAASQRGLSLYDVVVRASAAAERADRHRMRVAEADRLTELTQRDPFLRSRAAASDQASPTVLAGLATDASEVVRAQVALNRSTSPDVRAALASDPHWLVRSQVARVSTDPAVLAAMASDPDRRVRAQVVRNSAATPATRARLSADPDPRIATIASIAGHDSIVNAVNAASGEPLDRARAAESDDASPALLARLTGDPSEVVRARVARNRNVAPELLTALASDPHWLVRATVAGRSTQSAVLDALASDPHPQVRATVADNTAAAETTRARAATGTGLRPDSGQPDPVVADANGFDRHGFDRNGFDRDGFHRSTYDRFDTDGYDRDGYDRSGLDRGGFGRTGVHRGTGTRVDENGYDRNGVRPGRPRL